MANELAIAMRDAGTELAETFANRDSSGSRTRYGTVMANNGATLDVELAGGSVSGVPMTTACVGARAGDRVLLTVDGPLITATGILATADNGPYVPEVVMRCGCYHVGNVGPGSGANVTVPLSMPSTDYAISITNATSGDGWTKICFSAPNNLRKNGFDVAVWSDTNYTTLNVWFWWSALLVR